MDCVEFEVNCVKYSVSSEVSSTTTLLQYIREYLELRGTKYMCLEAGCGACIVSVVKSPQSLPEAVNSCMVSITSCHGWKITTIENLGNRLVGYHPLQKSLAENNGSQCGYCSPGFVMSMFSLLKSKKNITMLEIERQISSNICRCTGYRPILDAFKKFASDAPKSESILDIEDTRLCNKSSKVCPKSSCDESDWCFVSNDGFERIFHIELNDGRQWYRAQNVKDIFEVFRINGGEPYMLVAGNTGKGVRRIVEYPKILIDVSKIQELKGYYFDQNFVVGAGTTFSELISILKEVADTEYFDYLKIFNDHLELVANVAVRNIGTIAGNLMLKYLYRDFQSDIFILLLAVGAGVTLMSAPGTISKHSMEEFLNVNMKEKVILNILMPPLSKQNKLVSFKVSARTRNAHAIVNAVFRYKLNTNNSVEEARIVYGGLSPTFSRAKKTENVLIGKSLFDNFTLQAALKALSKELVVIDNPPEPSVQYRKKLALGLFYKGLLQLCPDKILNPLYLSGRIKLTESRPVSRGSQSFITDPNLWPLNQPVPKAEALIQCAGEAVYAEDLPALPYEVYAAFVVTTVGSGSIKNIDAGEALKQPGVIAFYTAKDILGINSFTPPEDSNSLTNEEILCTGEIKYFNQPLGIIVADTYDVANRTALLVKVTYHNVTKPEISVKVNKNNSRKTKLYSSSNATKRGNNVKKVIKAEDTVFGQYYFCLENIACVSWPTDDGIRANPTTHYIDADQLMIARSLAIDQNRVDISVPRVGGSYGLKLSRQGIVSTACSLVAYKLNRPCRFLLPLRSQTRALGKRMPSTINYEIGVDSNGVIQYINYDLYEDNGYIVNELLIKFTTDTYYNCYKKDTWNFRCFNTITDTPSNSWFRSPGTLETIKYAETMMERIAYELGLDPLQVRLNNLDTNQFPDILDMIHTLKINAKYAERRAKVDKFNLENRWKKRGLRFALMRWVTKTPFSLNITLSVYHGDGSVAITHGGVELGQGINTKAIQVCAYFLKIPMNKIKIKPSSTTSNCSNSRTASSLTTQNVVLGVQRSCEIILKRLKPIKDGMKNATWEQVIAKAYELGVNLQANGVVDFNDVYIYNIYGVTLAEVEVDILTGEWLFIQADILEDVGRSVSPAIDIGQVEGAFIQGVGYHTSEELVYNSETGELLTDRTWNYHVPAATDIPTVFNVYFRRRSYSFDVILGSKATGEPAICLGVVVPLAIREAIVSARQEAGIPSNIWFQIDGPHTVEKICLACETNIKDFKFNQ